MEGFRQITLNEVMIISGETRDLGRLVLEVGTLAEAVTVTAEVTPVNTTTGSLQRNMTGDQLTMIQVKGRDIFGMMKILPGVSDTTFSRDYAAWQSGRGLSINGGTSLNKNTTIDGVSVGEEGGDGTTHVTPNLDSIGEVTVITNGYTAENGRQSSGLIRIVTKSGTNQLKGSAWYNARRDEWNANDYLRKKQGAEKPFFEVDISGYSIGGPVVIPGLFDSRSADKKLFFFFSQEFVDDVRPTAVLRTNLPTEAERAGRLLANPPDERHNPADHRSADRTGVPGEHHSAEPHPPHGPADAESVAAAQRRHQPAAGQQWTSNDAQDTTPIHKRRNFIMRIDAVLSASQRFSVRSMLDRDDSITLQPRGARRRLAQQRVPRRFRQRLAQQSAEQLDGQRDERGLLAQPLRLPGRDRRAQHGGLHVCIPFELPVRSAAARAIWCVWRSEAGPHQRRRIPVYARHPLPGRHSDESRAVASMGRKQRGHGPTWNENYRYTFQNDLSWTKGRHNMKFGFVTERDAKTEPGSATYTGVYNFGHSGDNPLSTGNGYANALLGYFTRYEERTNRIDRERRHWQTDFYAQDSWRMTPRMTLDYGLRVAHHGAIYEVRDMNSAFDPGSVRSEESTGVLRAVLHDTVSAERRRARQPTGGRGIR